MLLEVSQGANWALAKSKTSLWRGPMFMADPGLIARNIPNERSRLSHSQIPIPWPLLGSTLPRLSRSYSPLLPFNDTAMSVDPALTGSALGPRMPAPLVVR